MIIIVGLVILIAAVIAGVAGVLANSGSGHALTHGFAVFGYHVTGSTGTLFLYGIVVGAAGLLGLTLLLAGARRTSRRGSAARRGLEQSRRETAAATQARDDLIDQRDTARAYTASSLGNGTPGDGPPPDTSGGRWNRLRLPGRRPAPQQAAGMNPQSGNGQSAPQTPAGASTPADDSPEGVSQP
ncbi:MAG: hypothetical protein ACHP9Z_01010 [Streptosporangiales bacterium]